MAEHGLVNTDIDDLAAPGFLPVAQRQHDADRTVQARQVIAQRRGTGHDRRLARKPGQIGQPTESVGDVREAGAVAIGSGLAVTRHPQENQAGIDLTQFLPTDAPFLHGPRSKVFDQHVGFPDQLEEQLHALLLPQVDQHRFFIARLAEPSEGGVMALGRRTEAPHRIARQWMLHLEHLGTEFAQHRSRVRASQKVPTSMTRMPLIGSFVV